MTKNTKLHIKNLIDKYYFRYCDGIITRDTALGLATCAVLKCLARTRTDGPYIRHKYIATVVNCVESRFTNWGIA